MQLENFSSAWKQIKLTNAIQSMDSQEILLIIGNTGNADRTRLQTVLLSVAMFVVVTMFCQGG